MRQVYKTGSLLHAKALTSADEPGTFEAIVSVFGNEDADGEAVAPGAFTETLQGPPAPITFSHQWGEVPIGKTLEAEQLDRAALQRLVPDLPDDVEGGLYAKAKLHVDGDFAIERAKAVYRNLIENSLREFSWGGAVREERVVNRDNQRPLIVLEKVDLVEWGPCLKGANSRTALLAAKSLQDLTDGDELAAALLAAAGVLKAGTQAERRTGAQDPPRGGLTADQLLMVAGCPTTDSPQKEGTNA